MPVVRFRHDCRQILIPTALTAPIDGFASMTMEKLTGLVDTGATLSGVSKRVGDSLGLPRAGKMTISTPQGDHFARLYRFAMGLFPNETDPQALPFILPDELLGIECSPGAQFDVLIGMDVLGRGNLLIERNGTGSFSF